MTAWLVSTFRRGVHPLYKGQYANSVCNFLGPQLVLAMERGQFHKGQNAVSVIVCGDHAILRIFPLTEGQPKYTITGRYSQTGTMTKSVLRGGVHL